MSRKPTAEAIESKEKIKGEQEDKERAERAKARLRLAIVEDEHDLQDDRFDKIREAVFFANMMNGVQDRMKNAQLSYRLGKKFGNTQMIETAEGTMKDAMRDEEISDPELMSILPLCPIGLLQVDLATFNVIMKLPVKYRKMIGVGLVDDDLEEGAVQDGQGTV